MLVLEIIGFVIIFLSWLIVCWLIPCILEKKYGKELDSVYWYLWGLLGMGMGIGSVLILIFC